MVRPRTVQVLVDADGVEQVLDPGFEKTVYLRIADPPFDLGAVHLTVARALPAVATGRVGAPGTLANGVSERLTVVPANGVASEAGAAISATIPQAANSALTLTIGRFISTLSEHRSQGGSKPGWQTHVKICLLLRHRRV